MITQVVFDFGSQHKTKSGLSLEICLGTWVSQPLVTLLGHGQIGVSPCLVRVNYVTLHGAGTVLGEPGWVPGKVALCRIPVIAGSPGRNAVLDIKHRSMAFENERMCVY